MYQGGGRCEGPGLPPMAAHRPCGPGAGTAGWLRTNRRWGGAEAGGLGRRAATPRHRLASARASWAHQPADSGLQDAAGLGQDVPARVVAARSVRRGWAGTDARTLSRHGQAQLRASVRPEGTAPSVVEQLDWQTLWLPGSSAQLSRPRRGLCLNFPACDCTPAGPPALCLCHYCPH